MGFKDYIKKIKHSLGTPAPVNKEKEVEQTTIPSKDNVTKAATHTKKTAAMSKDSKSNKVKKKKIKWDANAINEYYIGETARVTGDTKENIKILMAQAKKDYGISSKDYFLYGFYDIPLEEHQAMQERLRAEKKARKEQRERDEIAMNEEHLTNLVKVTGEDREVLRQRIQSITEPYDVSIEYYDVFRFWELTPEEQKTFFVKGDADKLNKRYNNKPVLKKFFMNKDIFAVRFADYLGRTVIPTAGIKQEEIIHAFGPQGKVMYKPLTASRGHDIEVFEYDESNLGQMHTKLLSMPKGVLEGLLTQHPEMQKLSLKAVNTIRVVTILTKDLSMGIQTDKVHFVYFGLRMACGDGYLDNLHSGGMIAGLDAETGIVLTPGIDFANHQHEVHPDTGTPIVGFQVPCFDQIKELVSKAGAGIEGYYGWDIAITPDGPVVVEINTNPGAGILQTPYSRQHKGMFHVVAPFLPEEERR